MKKKLGIDCINMAVATLLSLSAVGCGSSGGGGGDEGNSNSEENNAENVNNPTTYFNKSFLEDGQGPRIQTHEIDWMWAASTWMKHAYFDLAFDILYNSETGSGQIDCPFGGYYNYITSNDEVDDSFDTNVITFSRCGVGVDYDDVSSGVSGYAVYSGKVENIETYTSINDTTEKRETEFKTQQLGVILPNGDEYDIEVINDSATTINTNGEPLEYSQSRNYIITKGSQVIEHSFTSTEPSPKDCGVWLAEEKSVVKIGNDTIEVTYSAELPPGREVISSDGSYSYCQYRKWFYKDLNSRFIRNQNFFPRVRDLLFDADSNERSRHIDNDTTITMNHSDGSSLEVHRTSDKVTVSIDSDGDGVSESKKVFVPSAYWQELHGYKDFRIGY